MHAVAAQVVAIGDHSRPAEQRHDGGRAGERDGGPVVDLGRAAELRLDPEHDLDERVGNTRQHHRQQHDEQRIGTEDFVSPIAGVLEVAADEIEVRRQREIDPAADPLEVERIDQHQQHRNRDAGRHDQIVEAQQPFQHVAPRRTHAEEMTQQTRQNDQPAVGPAPALHHQRAEI